MVRNILEGAGPLGTRLGAVEGVWSNARDAAHTVSRWLVPDRVPTPVGALAVVVAVVLIVTMIWRGASDGGEDRRGAWALFPIVAFGVTSGGVLLGSSLAAITHLEARYLAPLFVPLVVLVAWSVDRLWTARDNRRRPVAVAAVGALTIWLIVSLGHAISITVDRARDGVGYASSAWDGSALAARAARTPAGSSLFSNDHIALYALTGRQPVLPSPRRVPGTPVAQVDDVRHLLRRSCTGRVLLAWFEPREGRISVPLRVELDELRTVFRLEVVATVDDGKLFRLTPRHRATDCPLP